MAVAERDDEVLEELARRAQAGDPAALDELLARIRPLVLGRCRRFLPASTTRRRPRRTRC